MGVALCCVWAAYITQELSETAAAIILPSEVAAESAEPPRAVASAAVSSEVVSTAAVSPEVAALAAEPPQAAVLTSEQSEGRAPSNDAPPAHHVTVKVTVSELSSCPDDTTVDPLEVATLAAQTPEVSVVVFPQAMVGPATAMEVVYRSSTCPAMAMEAVSSSLSCSVAVSESSSYVELTREASQEPSFSPATATKNSVGGGANRQSISHTKHEQLTQPVLTKECLSEQSVCHVPTEFDFNISTGVLPYSELFTRELNYELLVCSVVTWEIFDGLSGFPASVLGAVNAKSVFFVPVSPRPLCLSWCLNQSGLPWRSSTLCRPLW